MPKASPIQTSFNAGEFSPTMDGRVDFDRKYPSACRQLINFIPLVQGPALRRSGTKFVEEVKDSDDRTWLIPFEFAETDAYILEFGDQYIRFYTNYGRVILGTTPAAWVTSTAYDIGDLVSESGTNYYCVTAHTSGTFATDLSNGNWYALTGSVYEIPTPYTIASMVSASGSLRLRTVQSGDVIYIVHPDYAPRKLSRFAPTTWTLTEVDFRGGPFLDVDPDETTTVTASGTTGSITLTASAALFSASDVGSLFFIEEKDLSYIKPWASGQELSRGTTSAAGPNVLNTLRRSDGKTYKCVTSAAAPATTPESVIRTGGDRPIHTNGVAADGDGEQKYPVASNPRVFREGVDWEFQDPGYGIVKITGFTSSTSVTATVVSSKLPDGVTAVATTRWAFSRWSSTRGWPNNVAFFRERLVFSTGQILNFSVSGDFENFSAKNESGEIAADQAITIEIASDTVNDVQWLMPSDGLLIGTAGGEFLCKELTTDEVFGPGNVKIAQQSTYGSRNVLPVQVGETIIFVQRAGRKLRELQYDFSSDGYKSSDLNVLAEHITSGGLIDIVYQQEPHSIIWAARADGTLLGFTFNREQDVLGWHRHPLGGEGIVECMETIPSPANGQDDLWMIVKRTIDGQTKRYIEYLMPDFTNESDIVDAFFVDCGLTYDGSPATTISGLGHLEGEEVDVLVDGATHPRRTVESGEIELQREGSKVHIGFPYNSLLQTMRLEAGAADGTAQGKTKRITKAVIRFLATVGARAGADPSQLDEIQFRSPSNPMDQAVPPFTGDKLIEWPGSYDFDGYIYISQPQALPMTIVSIMPQVHTQDR